MKKSLLALTIIPLVLAVYVLSMFAISWHKEIASQQIMVLGTEFITKHANFITIRCGIWEVSHNDIEGGSASVWKENKYIGGVTEDLRADCDNGTLFLYENIGPVEEQKHIATLTKDGEIIQL